MERQYREVKTKEYVSCDACCFNRGSGNCLSCGAPTGIVCNGNSYYVELGKQKKKKHQIKEVVELWYNEEFIYSKDHLQFRLEYAEKALFKIMEILGVKG